MFNDLSEEETRSYCRRTLESLELWLRRLIDYELRKKLGPDYFDKQDNDSSGRYYINSTLRNKATRMIEENPGRYTRKIDTTFLDDLISIVTNPDLFRIKDYGFFEPALSRCYPDGHQEAKTFLSRLVGPRNCLSHANPISVRQAEQVICYSHDVIESLKHYFVEQGMEQYNAPTILKVHNSFGQTIFMPDAEGGITSNKISYGRNSTGRGHINYQLCEESWLRPGDILSIEVEIDQNFSTNEYEVHWAVHNGPRESLNNTSKIVIPIKNIHVNHNFNVSCIVKSTIKDWHRCGDVDDSITFIYKVLPPIEQ